MKFYNKYSIVIDGYGYAYITNENSFKNIYVSAVNLNSEFYSNQLDGQHKLLTDIFCYE